jgi:hypothetical protein
MLARYDIMGQEDSRSKDKTGDNQILPWSSVEQMCTEYKQSVEPTSSLINTLSNEVGGVRLVESINILKGVVRLSVGHGTRFEPTIKDFFDPLQITFTLLRGDGDTVDTLSVEIGDIVSTGKFLELFDGADANDFLHVFTRPEGDGGTPVSVSRDVPITSVLEPLTESTLSDVLWDPDNQHYTG